MNIVVINDNSKVKKRNNSIPDPTNSLPALFQSIQEIKYLHKHLELVFIYGIKRTY